MSDPRRARVLALLLAALVGLGCESDAEPQGEEVVVGLFLSFSGAIAANSANSERAFRMAIETANGAGGLDGRRVGVLSRDTGSDPAKVEAPARELADRTVLVVGPDVQDLAIALRGVFGQRTLILPSFATSFVHHKPTSWFVLGPGPRAVVDQMFTLAQADGRQRPLVIAAPNGYDSQIGSNLNAAYAVPQVLLPREGASEEVVRTVVDRGADAFFLSAPPPVAASLIYSLVALGRLGDPRQWYLSPTLHTPSLLENLPRGILDGARVVSAGGGSREAEAFATSFRQRWKDEPLDDAYSFYDAGAIVVLAMQRALFREGVIPRGGTGLDKHLVAVTSAAGTPIRWNEIGRGLELLRAQQEVSYVGLTGPLQFDDTGKSLVSDTRLWIIRDHSFQH